jgi:hypothetical protein
VGREPKAAESVRKNEGEGWLPMVVRKAVRPNIRVRSVLGSRAVEG